MEIRAEITALRFLVASLVHLMHVRQFVVCKGFAWTGFGHVVAVFLASLGYEDFNGAIITRDVLDFE